jgi:hypothetical protein
LQTFFFPFFDETPVLFIFLTTVQNKSILQTRLRYLLKIAKFPLGARLPVQRCLPTVVDRSEERNTISGLLFFVFEVKMRIVLARELRSRSLVGQHMEQGKVRLQF